MHASSQIALSNWMELLEGLSPQMEGSWTDAQWTSASAFLVHEGLKAPGVDAILVVHVNHLIFKTDTYIYRKLAYIWKRLLLVIKL